MPDYRLGGRDRLISAPSLQSVFRRVSLAR
jgi:hypothetical protein